MKTEKEKIAEFFKDFVSPIGKIDFSDPRVISIMEQAKKQQKEILALLDLSDVDFNRPMDI